MLNFSKNMRMALVFSTSAVATTSFATDISIVALSNGKAMLIIDGKGPKNYAAGAVINEHIKLISVDRETAIVEVDGKKQLLQLGRTVLQATAENSVKKLVLQANDLGHFIANGQINGGSSVRMMVDTGASFVTLSSSEARRLGIDYHKGKIGRSATANGIVKTYHVSLDSIKLGEIELFQVEAAIHESELPFALLGMSFLNRVTMLREGQQMTLTKKN